MAHLQQLSRCLGYCAKCRYNRDIYFVPGLIRHEVACRRCRLPLKLGPETVIEAWKTPTWAFLPVVHRITPDDVMLFRRRENLLASLPPWERAALGLSPTRIEHDLVPVQLIRARCDSCGTKIRTHCLTDYARKRLACPDCRRPFSGVRTTAQRAGLDDHDACWLIGDLTPLAPVIVATPANLSVMSPDDLELMGMI